MYTQTSYANETTTKHPGMTGNIATTAPESETSVTTLASRFGEIRVDLAKTIVFPKGLLGMPDRQRYVLAEFGGKQFVTEWVGGVRETESTPLAKRKVMRTLSSADAANMSQAELRAIAANPRTPESVRKQARAALRDKAREAAK